MSKSVLFLADSYHYSPSPNGACVERLANALVADGIDVSVISMGNQYVNDFEEINGISVYRVRTFPEWEIMYKKSSSFIRRLKSAFFKMKKALYVNCHPLNSKSVLNAFIKKG